MLLPAAMFSNTEWHSIRPWAPTLSLSVREITSVSATFLLSSTLSGDFDSSLASIGLEAAAADDDPENPQDEVASSSMPGKTNSVIADALAQGLSVNVNGSPWPRAFVRIDDQRDEAVIIIYALMPGRQYDIELGLAPAGQPTSTVHRQVTTDGESKMYDSCIALCFLIRNGQMVRTMKMRKYIQTQNHTHLTIRPHLPTHFLPHLRHPVVPFREHPQTPPHHKSRWRTDSHNYSIHSLPSTLNVKRFFRPLSPHVGSPRKLTQHSVPKSIRSSEHRKGMLLQS